MKESKQRQIFDQWLTDHKALLFKVVRAYARDREDQDDLFQEVCLQVYRSIPNFKELSAVTTWIYRISLNTAIKWSTKERKHMESHEAIQHGAHVLENKDHYEDDRIAWLYQQIHQFNEVDRSISLLLLEGYSYKEMSGMLGITESNIGVKIHRIKRQLIACLLYTSDAADD